MHRLIRRTLHILLLSICHTLPFYVPALGRDIDIRFQLELASNWQTIDRNLYAQAMPKPPWRRIDFAEQPLMVTPLWPVGGVNASRPPYAVAVAVAVAAACRGGHDRIYLASDSRAGEAAAPGGVFESLEAALRAASGHRAIVAVADGQYAIAHTLVIPDGIDLRACAHAHPVLQATPALVGPIFAARHAANISIQGLAFEAHGAHQLGLELEQARCAVVVGNEFRQFDTAVVLSGVSLSRIAGNRVDGARQSGIEAKDASDGNIIEDNSIFDIAGPETHGGGIFLHGANNNQLRYNLVRGADGMGIGIANWDASTVSIGNAVVGNRIEDVDRTSTDSGAIYFLGRSRMDMASQVASNWIDGTGRPDQHSVGIYLDDSASGVEVTRNVVRHVGSDAAQIHGGSNNTLENNIFDLTASRASAVLFQGAPADTNPDNRQEHNVVQHNLLIAGGDHPVYFWLDGGRPEIVGNVYAAVPREDVPQTPTLQDRAPTFIATLPKEAAYVALQRAAARISGFVPFDNRHAGPRPHIDTQKLDGCSRPAG